MWMHKTISLPSFNRGFHIITSVIERNLPEIRDLDAGLVTLSLLHTSASLSLNENADPTVRDDLEYVFNRLIPENDVGYLHTMEGPDDLPAHVKSALLGTQLSLPVSNGSFVLGTWQGIVLGEHRNNAGSRTISALIQGGSI